MQQYHSIIFKSVQNITIKCDYANRSEIFYNMHSTEKVPDQIFKLKLKVFFEK